MKNLKQLIQNNKENTIFLLFFIIAFIFSLNSKYIDGGDDIFFKTIASNSSLPNFIISRYTNWSGRIIPDIMAYLFNNTFEFLWPFFNSLFITILAILIFNYNKLLINIKNNKNSLLAIFTCFSFLLISKTIIEPAFLWKTGSLNYLWPTTMGLFTLYPFLLSIKNKLNKKNNFLYFFVSLLTVISTEQVSIALIMAITTYFIYMYIYKKTIPYILYLIFTNLIIGSMIIFLAPGNLFRLHAEAKHNFPDFFSLSIFNRISISLYWILNKLLNFCSLSLALIHLIIGYKNLFTKNIALKRLSIISILLGIIFLVKNILNINFNILPITSNNYFVYNIIIKYIISFASLSLIPFLIWKLSNKINKPNIYILIIFVALTCALINTLSPTIDASGNRVLFLPIILINNLIFLVFI